jgi:hypothetical protein
MTDPTWNAVADTTAAYDVAPIDPGQPAMTLPCGIEDAQRWRDRVVALLTAADSEGLLLWEIVGALKSNFGVRFDSARVEKWLFAEAAAGTVIRDGDSSNSSFWYTAEAAPTTTDDPDPASEIAPADQQPTPPAADGRSRRHLLRGGRS